jgi:Glycosyltransferase family 87
VKTRRNGQSEEGAASAARGSREPRLGARGRFERVMFRVLAYRSDVDGRIFLAGAIGIYFLVVAIPRAGWGIDIWPRLGVPSGPSLFFDTRNLTAALECRRLGFDPLVESPCDPWGRPLNYPRVWLVLRWLGLNQSHTVPLALFFIALFLFSIFVLVGRVSVGRGMLISVAVCSPSVMFAVERANMDIVVFTVLVLGVVVWRFRERWGGIASPLLVLLAATAKIYPVFGLPAYLFVRRREAAITALVCSAAFAVYALVTIGDIEAIARIAPQGEYHSFGARILPAAIYHEFVPDRWQGGDITKQLVAVIPLMIGGALLWLAGRRRLPEPDETHDSPTRLAFYLGSMIFLGTFAVGNNFDYRLVFMILMLPQLFEWAGEAPRDPRGGLAATTIAVVLFLLWIGALSEPLALTDEVVTWAAVGSLLALLGASVPRLRSVLKVIRSP